MRIALDRHLLGDADAADLRDAADVVAAEVEQHHVFGPLLRGGRQLGGECVVALARGATRTRAGDRP